MTARCRYVLLTLMLNGVLTTTLRAQEQPDFQALPRPDDAPIRFDHLTINDGLSQQSVYAIVQDRHGFMWFCTQDGLNRYDGYTFKVYQHDPRDPNSLPGDYVTGILEDRDGMLWTRYAFGGGLSRFDPGTETFTTYQHDASDPGSLSDNRTWALLEDRAGVLWVGTEAGLDRFEPDTGTFTHFLPVPDDVDGRGNAVYSLLEDAAGMLWVGTGDGLFRYDQAADSFTRYRLYPEAQTPQDANLVTGLYEDRQGTLWVGAWGLHRFDREAGTFEPFLMDPQASEPSLWGENRVRAILEDDTGTLWVGGTGVAGGGLNRFDRATGTPGSGPGQAFTRYLHDPSDPRSLNSNVVWSLYQDRQGIVWVGTSGGGGLSRFDRTTRLFALYPARSSAPNSLQGGSPRGIHLDRDDVLWIGTIGGVLNRYDRRRGVYTYYRHDEADPASLLPGPVEAVHRDRQGQLWVGSAGSGGGLSLLDEATGRFTHYRHDPNDPASLADDDVRVIYEDRAGQLWVGTHGGGLNRFDPETETFTRYEHDENDPQSLSSNNVRSIHEDHDGQLWVGTWDGGLNRFDPETEAFTHYERDPDDPQSLNHNAVLGLYERPREPGILWVGLSGGGLDRLEVETGRFTHYTSQNSDLPNNTVYGVLGDEEGHLWMSTNSGLARFDPDTDAFTVFTTEDGLQMLEFDVYAFHRGYNGELFFGGAGGVNAVRPGDVFGNPHPPEVALTGLRLFNEPVTPGPDGPLRRSITETEAVTFTHDENDVTLEYVGLHFRRPEQNQYAYMLEGYDEGWREVGTERRAVYTNLPHGRYTFRVRASNSDGVWNQDGARLAITILPPWWRTWWAYTIYGMLLLGGVFAVDRFQRRRLIAKERERAREREREQEKEHAREIEEAHAELQQAHTHLKATQAQLVQQEKMASLGALTAGIAHEIKNPLNFVNNFSEITGELAAELAAEIEASADKSVAEVARDFKEILADLQVNAEQIHKHGQRADGIVQAMMQHASGGTGEREATDVNALVNEYIDLAYHGIRARMPGFTCEVEKDLGADVGLVEMVPQEMGRVVLNLVGNAFDAVQGQPKPKITVSTSQADGQVEIRVSDNGSGIPAEIKDKIFEPFFTTKPTGSGTGLGLSLAYDIVTQGHGGTLTVESREGEGATFVVTLPADSSA